MLLGVRYDRRTFEVVVAAAFLLENNIGVVLNRLLHHFILLLVLHELYEVAGHRLRHHILLARHEIGLIKLFSAHICVCAYFEGRLTLLKR